MKRNFYVILLFISFVFIACDYLKNDEEVYMTGISVNTKNCKTNYYIGEEFDSTGIIVKANYIGKSDKDITNLVRFTGFDSSFENSYQKITVLYTENEETYTTYFYVGISKYPRATYPYNKSRIVKVSFQYYRRESTSEAFQPYTYSEEPYDDINGSVEFGINDYGMNYKVGDVVDIYKYYPNKSYEAYSSFNYDESKIKTTKYIVGNTVFLEEKPGSIMPNSYLFTDKADVLGTTSYGTSSEISVIGAKTLTFEDDIFKHYKSDYNKNEKHITFKNNEYPQFETNENNELIKGTILKQINNFFVCILTVETTLQDVNINFPAELWGIDHLD